MPVVIRYEQAVYGSFPFWDKGYATLARSPGCRDEWLADLKAACQRYGERPPHAAEAGGLMALRLPSGPWAIIRPSPQGSDDRGRPGALAFHALFLSGSDYRKAGAFPFEFATSLRADWTPDTSLLSGSLTLDTPTSTSIPAGDRASRIAKALLRGRRVAIESEGPIDDLARAIWLALPVRRRARLSLATWTYANGNRHDLAALPRLAGVALDSSYVDPATLSHPRDPAEDRIAAIPLVGVIAWSAFALFALTALGFAWLRRDRTDHAMPAVVSPDRDGSGGTLPHPFHSSPRR
jgi:hypothetical protein